MLVLAADLLRDVVAVLEDADHEQEDVFEVEEVPLPFDLLVHGIDLADLGGVARGFAEGLDEGRRVVGGDGLGDLGPFDLGGDVAQLGAVEAEAAAEGRVGDGLRLAVEEAGQVASDGFRPEVLELAQGGGMEGAGLHAGRAELPEPPRISPAARLVKVTASTLAGWRMPARTP